MNPSLPDIVLDEPLRRLKLAVVRGTPPRLHPVGRYQRRSYEHLEPRRAVCHRHRHRAPAVDCTCGFHAVSTIDGLTRVTTVLADSVILDVELGGLVIEHERGVRAEEQAVLGVGFPDRCSWCSAEASVVVPGRLWRSACAACSTRRTQGRTQRVLTRAEATAELGVDVSFVPAPAEPRQLHSWGSARAAGMALLSIVVLVLALMSSATAPTVAIAVVALATSAAITVAATRSRSARPHADWFVMQCACVTMASLALRFVG